jgi:hypothetical protein
MKINILYVLKKERNQNKFKQEEKVKWGEEKEPRPNEK